jgi:hypothetical protein
MKKELKAPPYSIVATATNNVDRAGGLAIWLFIDWLIVNEVGGR